MVFAISAWNLVRGPRESHQGEAQDPCLSAGGEAALPSPSFHSGGCGALVGGGAVAPHGVPALPGM